MAACCGTIESLGCQDHCDEISMLTNSNDTLAGVYILSEVGGARYSQTFTAMAKLSFTSNLNEDKITVFQVFDPNGQLVTSTAGFTCFQVWIRPRITL